MARVIATSIGATMVGGRGNECVFRGKRATVKCAAVSTDSVGVYYTVIERLDCILAAFEVEGGDFEVYEVKPTFFLEHRRESAGSGRGKSGQLRRRQVVPGRSPIAVVQRSEVERIWADLEERDR